MEHLFYNPELKLKYLKANSRNEKAVTAFKNFAKFESDLDIDLAAMDREVIINIMNELAYTEPTTVRNLLSAINVYKRWCCNNYVPQAIECFPPIDLKKEIDFVKTIRDKFYPSFDELYNELMGFYDFKQGDEAAPALCLFWLGFGMNEICNLKTELVDLNNGNIYDEQGHIIVGNIDHRIIDIFRQYKTTEIATRTQHWEITVYKYEAGYFIHRMVTKNSNKGGTKIGRQQVSARILAAAEESYQKYRRPSKLSGPAVAKSGALHRIYELEQNGIDIKSSASKTIVERAYGSSGFQYADVVFQYECYKKAFNLQ